ncbi:hypothetical protein ECN1_1994 [Escherichia coli N1]|nr:hypothetical protein ECN1_1994 [Escherichia coli N1]
MRPKCCGQKLMRCSSGTMVATSRDWSLPGAVAEERAVVF